LCGKLHITTAAGRRGGTGIETSKQLSDYCENLLMTEELRNCIAIDSGANRAVFEIMDGMKFAAIRNLVVQTSELRERKVDLK
jgi:hypothetical protein